MVVFYSQAEAEEEFILIQKQWQQRNNNNTTTSTTETTPGSPCKKRHRRCTATATPPRRVTFAQDVVSVAPAAPPMTPLEKEACFYSVSATQEASTII